MDPKTKSDETPTPAAIVGNFAETVIEALTAGTFAETLRDLSLQSRLMVQAHQSTISYSPSGIFHAAIHAHSFSEKYGKYDTYDVIAAGEGIRELVVEQRQSVRLTQDELLSDPQWKTFRDLRDDRDLAHPPMRGWLAVPIVRRDGGFVGMLQASDRIEGDFDEMDVQVFERLARMISPTFELQYVNQELQRKTQELQFAYAAHGEIETEPEKSSIVRETGNELSGIDSLDDAMDLWARQARSIVGAHQSAVSYIPRGDFAEGKHAISMSEKYDKYKTYDVLPTGKGIWALVARQKLSFCMTDEELKSHPAWKNFSDLRDERDLEHPPMRGWLAVPVLSRESRFVGVLQLTDKYEGDFTEQDLDRLTRLAQLMAPAFSLQFANEEMQLRSEELAMAKSVLEQSNVELQQFAYIASHDLQTPLRAVAGFAQFLQRDYQGQLDEKADERIERIVEGCQRMQTMINDLLTYSRVESRSRPFATTDLNDVFDDAVAMLHSSIQDSSGKVTRGELPTVAADRSQLFQLLQNLIGNGLKYYGHEPPQVYVSAEQNAGEWTVAVRDNGIGIDAKHHERIFEIFRRLHSQDKYPGTGIGLAVCRRIVRRHNGRIWLESEVDKGSTFYFTIPKTASEQ